MQTIDKMDILARLDKTFFTTADLKKSFKLKPASLKKAVSRMAKRGLITRLARNIYILPGREIDAKKIASQLYAPYAYISFESALSAYGIISQVPYAVTMASCKTTKVVPFLGNEIHLKKIKKALFFGYRIENDTLIADPEKALLDTLYMKSKGLTDLKGEDLTLTSLSKNSFLEMSKAFPRTVQKEARLLAKKMK